MMLSLKEFSIVFGIVASIVGASVGYGKHSQEIKDTKEILIEVKTDAKEKMAIHRQEIKELNEAIAENSEVNVRQTVVLESITKVLEKLDH